MKLKKINISILCLFIIFFSCEKEDIDPGQIEVIVPEDQSLNLNTGFPFELVFAEGQNLSDIQRITFDGRIETVFNPALNSDVAVIFTVPFNEDLGSRFGKQTISFLQLNGNRIEKEFEIIQPEPEISTVEPEQPKPGDSFIVTGNWLQNTIEVSLNGQSLEFSQIDGERIAVVLSEDFVEGGTLLITTGGGSDSRNIDLDTGIETILVTNFDGDGILPNEWQAFGEVASSGLVDSGGGDGNYYELTWNGPGNSFIIAQSDAASTPLLGTGTTEGKDINDVFLRFDISCGTDPGSVLNIILVDGPSDDSDGNVNWLYSLIKENCDWETIEVPLTEFRNNYGGGDPTLEIDHTNLIRVKGNMNIYLGADAPSEQTIQLDNIKLIVK